MHWSFKVYESVSEWGITNTWPNLHLFSPYKGILRPFADRVPRVLICQCRHCRRQCKIFASSVNFSIFTHFFVFLSLKLLKLGDIDGEKFLAWKSGGVDFLTNSMSASTTKIKPMPLHNDTVPPSANRCCPLVTQYKTSSPRNAQLNQMDLVSCCIYIIFIFQGSKHLPAEHIWQLSGCSEAKTGAGALHWLPERAAAAMYKGSSTTVPTGALHRVTAGLRRRPPQDPSESEPDSAKEDVRRRWKQRSLSSFEADWW